MVAIIGDPIVNPVAQCFRDIPGERHHPPTAAKGTGKLDQRITFHKDFPICLAQQDHCPPSRRRVFGEIQARSELALQRGEGYPPTLVANHHSADGPRTERAVAIEEKYPAHVSSLIRNKIDETKFLPRPMNSPDCSNER